MKVCFQAEAFNLIAPEAGSSLLGHTFDKVV